MTTTGHPLSQDDLLAWLKEQLSEARVLHSLGARKKALELSQYFKLSASDTEKASVAALLHDCAKLMSPDELLTACRRLVIPISEDETRSIQTLHPFVGAELVRQRFGIDDTDILNAIRYHTTGRAGMTDVEKVVFIADKIEENTRNPLYTQKINAHLLSPDKDTLDRVVLYIQDTTIVFLIEKGQVIHPRTIEARNELVARLKAAESQKHQPVKP